jgi:PEP-CTERM motif
MPMGELMKRFVHLLVAVFALALSCAADSITINQPGGFFEFYSYAPQSYSYVSGEASNLTGGSEFYLSGSQKSLAGWLDSYSATTLDPEDSRYRSSKETIGLCSARCGTSFIDGRLSNGFFNTRTDVLHAVFSGYSYNWSTGQYMPFSGTFVEHFNINGSDGSWQWGTLGKGYLFTGTSSGLTTPEPGTLSLLATGLIGMALRSRKKFAATRTTNFSPLKRCEGQMGLAVEGAVPRL